MTYHLLGDFCPLHVRPALGKAGAAFQLAGNVPTGWAKVSSEQEVVGIEYRRSFALAIERSPSNVVEKEIASRGNKLDAPDGYYFVTRPRSQGYLL